MKPGESAPKLGPVVNTQKADINSSIHIFCDVRQGELPFFFEWFKNGQPIKSRPGVKWEIETSKQFSALNIQRISKEDSADYSCRVKNAFGSDSINVTLTVKGMQRFYSRFSFARDINIWRYSVH